MTAIIKYQARMNVLKMPLDELLATIDALYGRGRIEDVANIDEVRTECLRQVERDWRIEPEWGAV